MRDNLSDGALADLGTRQLRDTFGLFSRLAGGQVIESGPVFSYATGLPAFMANGAMVTGPATPDELRQSLDWVENSAELFLVTIDDRFLEPLVAALAERDLRPDDDPAPGMVLDPIPDLTDVHAGIEIEPVSESNYEAFACIISSIFAPAETVRMIFPLNMVTGDHVRVMMASLDGEIVGTAMAVRTGDLAGIYSVGTLEHARGRGVGRAVTAAAIEAAANGWGVKRIFLQSSQMGLSVYESLGFRTVASYQMLGGMRKAR